MINDKNIMLRKIRITLAAIFFIGITLLFMDFTGSLHVYLGWMTKVQFLPAVLALNAAVVISLIILTLVFGRIYCSVICPMGVMQDIIAWLGKKRKKNRYSYSKEKKKLRYAMLVIWLALLIAGIGGIAALLAPYSSFGRIAQNIFQPIYIFGNNILAAIAEKADSYMFYEREVWIRATSTFVIAAATLVIVAFLAWRNGRTYCNTICPVGTVLSFFSRFSWLKIYFDNDKCRNCSLCSKNCKAACIDFKTHTVDYSRCIVCGDCISKCKFGALRYGRNMASEVTISNNNDDHEKPEESSESIDNSKRTFLLAAAATTVTAALAQKTKQIEGGLAPIIDKEKPKRQTPITPPGSLSAEHMAQNCTACQLCVAECPNDVLRPSMDPMHFMQPVMSYEKGYCRPECHRCSEVCPTEAIKPITLAEKSATHVGHAVWVKKNCVILTDGVDCGNCERHCPVGAIQMIPLNDNDDASPLVPAVNEERCIGCGACENLCPARPFSAIYVEGHENQRRG
jgi:polyferredoxin